MDIHFPMMEDKMPDDKGSLEDGLAMKRTVERHEKPMRRLNKRINNQEGHDTMAHYGAT